jgi:hypothetical protein
MSSHVLNAALGANKPTYAFKCAENDYGTGTGTGSVLQGLADSYQQLGMFVEAKEILKK